jgi:c-di-GMP-binding flagellar brake protein YcgR
MTERDLGLEHPIQCTLILGTTTMVLKGKILEKHFMPKSTLKFQYRVLFIDISQNSQEEIINYIFSEQRKQRRVSFAPWV